MRSAQSYSESPVLQPKLFGFGKYFINNIPQQENSDDCGVFMCMFADLCSKDGYHSALLSPDFVINMESYRKKMLYSIIMQKLIWKPK